MPVCIKVSIKTGDIDMLLSTPDCGPGGGGRSPKPKEKDIFDLWDKRGLNKSDFEVGQLIAFVNQIKHI